MVASIYGLGTADGINEKGLVANLLWLTEADYGKRDPAWPGLSIAIVTQYVLDNFVTVAEAVDAAERSNIQLVLARLPGQPDPTVHLSRSDASGDSAIFEIVDGGKLRIHHSRACTVMTNSPPFEQQLANMKRFEGLGGNAALPGTSDAADRFVRAAYYVDNLSKPRDLREAYASLLSVMRNVAQPFVKGTAARPEASHTIWRTLADSTHRVYVFESSLRPNIIWVDLPAIDFDAKQPVRKLDLVTGGDLVGDVTALFKPSAPLTFKPAEP